MRSVVALSLLLCLPLPAAAEGQAAELSYDAIAASDWAGRSPDQISWSPDGRRLTYVWDDGRGEALQALDPATGQSEVLLPFADLKKAAGEDAGLDAYAWSPQGDALLLESGGDLYLFSLADRRIRRLTETAAAEEDPKISPDGTRVAFVRGYDLYLMDLATGKERRLTQGGAENVLLHGTTDWVYWEEIWDREATGFWWSPDGRKIAYYEFDERDVPVHPLVDESPLHPKVHWQKYPKPGDPNPKVRVGVLDLATGKTTWMATGDQDQYLARVAWTPAGDALAIQALARSQTRLDLLRCAAADGRCSPLLTESWPTWVNLANDFLFLPDGRFFWGSERSGRRALYLYGADGRLLRQVSPEGWAVTALDGLAGDGEVIFTGFRTQGLGPAERYVLRARLGEDRWENLTNGRGTHAAQPVARTGAWVHTWTSADLPGRLEVRRADGTAVPLPWLPPSKFDPAGLPHYEYLTIPGPEGSRLPARLLKPQGFDPSRRYPVIVYHYGGPGSQVVADKPDTRRRDLWHKRMAQRGFVVFSVDNQSSIFFGKKGEDLDYRRMGEVNLAGQLAGVEYLKSLPWVDPARIGLWGWSGGGYNTLYCLAHRPGVWKAGAAGAPVTDWHLYDSIWTERYLDTPQDNESGYLESSPLTHAARIKDRLLLIHGLADDNVHPQNTILLTDALVKAGIPFEQAFYPGQKHAVNPPSLTHFYARMEDFFERTLQEVVVEDVEVKTELP